MICTHKWITSDLARPESTKPRLPWHRLSSPALRGLRAKAKIHTQNANEDRKIARECRSLEKLAHREQWHATLGALCSIVHKHAWHLRVHAPCLP